MPGLSQVRRLEAVSFRSWPATNTHYDGAWAIRLTAGHPSRRLNSVNSLDPADHADLEGRIHRAAERFKAFGRPLVFRQSPLASPDLENILDARGWPRFDETIVMTADLDQVPLQEAIDQVPIKDAGRWVDDIITMKAVRGELKPGLSELIGSIQTSVGLFVTESREGMPYSAAMCVHDNDLAGLFEIVTHPEFRQQGRGREIVLSALQWAKLRGARRAWLQVVSVNQPAIALYHSLGFRETYRYAYRQAPEGHGR
jgi:ribosomal protein S18 acetylase RimI-like enzyme